MIEVYGDGAYNPGLDQGGWAAVVLENGQKRVFSGTARKTTSNRMELTAALEGILHTPQGTEMVVYTDSQYLFGTMTKGWQRRVNRDVWERLDEAVSTRKVRWEWIRGHPGNEFHKEAHNLATNLASQREMLHPVPSEQEERPLEVQMVDVGAKPVTERQAVAKGMVRMKPATLSRLKQGKMAKGDVLAVAQVAGIMAAKQTSQVIPLCHPLPIDEVKVEFKFREEGVEITAGVKSTAKTGVEMEALTAVAVAALTIYDMCKAVERGIIIEGIRLVRKSGGRSGTIVLE